MILKPFSGFHNICILSMFANIGVIFFLNLYVYFVVLNSQTTVEHRFKGELMMSPVLVLHHLSVMLSLAGFVPRSPETLRRYH